MAELAILCPENSLQVCTLVLSSGGACQPCPGGIESAAIDKDETNKYTLENLVSVCQCVSVSVSVCQCISVSSVCQCVISVSVCQCLLDKSEPEQCDSSSIDVMCIM